MNLKAWPFLVSRNTYLDYRTVVAPDFMCKAKISNLLARVVEGDLTEQNQAIIRQVVNSKAGDFTIVFQVVTAKERDIDTEGNDKVLKDQFGREIYLFEGIVIQGIGEVELFTKYLEIAHEKSMKSYRKFWKLIEASPAIPSQNFPTDIIDTSQLLKTKKIQQFNAKPQQKYSNKKFLNLRLYSSKDLGKRITSVAFSPNGKSIAIKDQDLKVLIWNFPFNESSCYELEKGMVASFSEFGSDRSIAFTPDGKFIAFSVFRRADENWIELYDLQLRSKRKVFRGHKPFGLNRISSLSFSPKGEFLASASQDKTVKLWNLSTEEEIKSLPHDNPINAMAISHDGYKIAIGDNHGDIKIWNLENQKEEILRTKTNLSSVKSIVFSPDSKTLVTGGEAINNFVDACYLQFWDLSNRTVNEIYSSEENSHGDVVNSVTFSPDGQILASAGKDKKIIFWSTNSRRKICPLSFSIDSAHSDEITSIDFAPKGNYLASAGKDKVVKIWNF